MSMSHGNDHLPSSNCLYCSLKCFLLILYHAIQIYCQLEEWAISRSMLKWRSHFKIVFFLVLHFKQLCPFSIFPKVGFGIMDFIWRFNLIWNSHMAVLLTLKGASLFAFFSVLLYPRPPPLLPSWTHKWAIVVGPGWPGSIVTNYPVQRGRGGPARLSFKCFSPYTVE